LLEIRDCLESEVLVDGSTFVTKDKHYLVTIKLVDYSLPNVTRVFSSLLEFIQYETVHYSRSSDEKGTCYALISYNSTSSYYCEICFIK
jgi:hypothetical protein